jgi:phenylpyruvate tautomerase PptA (4-oxalocrotonate tautomerase family)
MPLWTIYYPPGAFTKEEKQALTTDITKIYTDFGLPRFYVGVVYVPTTEEDFFMDDTPQKNFVRIKIDQIARSLPNDKRAWWVEKCDAHLKKHIADKGFGFEWHIDETPRDLWSIQGIPPPPPNSDAEKRWVSENKPTPY